MPDWALKIAINLAIWFLEKMAGRLGEKHCDRLSCLLPEAKPLKPEENPPPRQAENPWNNPPERGGKPR